MKTSFHHLCQRSRVSPNWRPGRTGAWTALWTSSGRRPGNGWWQRSARHPCDRTLPRKAPTASKSTSPRPRRASEGKPALITTTTHFGHWTRDTFEEPIGCTEVDPFKAADNERHGSQGIRNNPVKSRLPSCCNRTELQMFNNTIVIIIIIISKTYIKTCEMCKYLGKGPCSLWTEPLDGPCAESMGRLSGWATISTLSGYTRRCAHCPESSCSLSLSSDLENGLLLLTARKYKLGSLRTGEVKNTENQRKAVAYIL